MTLKFNGLEASVYHDFNPMVRKSWMAIKLGLVTIHEGVLCVKARLMQHGPNEKKKKEGRKGG